MEIKWNNLIALALIVFAVVVVAKTPTELLSFVSSIDGIATGDEPVEWTRGLIAFGFCLLPIVAAVKILVDNNRKE